MAFIVQNAECHLLSHRQSAHIAAVLLVIMKN